MCWLCYEVKVTVLQASLAFIFISCLCTYIILLLRRIKKMIHDKKTLELSNDFVASLFHELRTPLTAIKGSCDLMKRGIAGSLNSRQTEIVEVSSSAIERLINQVDQILVFARLGSEHFVLDKIDVCFDDVVQEALLFINPLIKIKGQQLILKLKAKVNVMMDRQLVLQVMLNLLANANKYTGEGGIISVETYMVLGHVYMKIHDNGIGIPLDKQNAIFTKFYRLNSHTPGTGLGLTICKQTIELHGGEIWLDSTVSKGSLFAFMLPLTSYKK